MSTVQIIPETKANKSAKLARWSHEEEKTLIDEITQGLTFEQIAASHGRSVGAIDFRLATLGRAAIESGTSCEEAMEKYKYTAETMKKLVAKKDASKKVKVEQPQLPFATAPQDRVLAYNKFVADLRAQVEAFKMMGNNDSALEANIMTTLCYASMLIDQLGSRLA